VFECVRGRERETKRVGRERKSERKGGRECGEVYMYERESGDIMRGRGGGERGR
jgi:hypothetical protein